MKSYVILLLVILHQTFSFAQNDAQLSIKLIDSRDSESYGNATPENEKLILYRIEEGNSIKGRLLDFSLNDSIFLDSLDAVTYFLTYQNIYGQKMEKHIQLYSKSHTDIKISIDSLDEYDNDILDLQNFTKSDTLTLLYKSIGCFKYEVKKMIVTKEKRFVARLYEAKYEQSFEDNNNTQNEKFTIGKLIKQVYLNDTQIIELTRFVNELVSIRPIMGCTTTDFYTLILPYGCVVKVEDGGCAWSGYQYLEKTFGIE